MRVARHFVQDRAVALGAERVVDDAALIAGELLANARQHGMPPVSVCVRGAADHMRIEVTDASPRTPIRPTPSAVNMTGRGLALVQALSRQWGVDRHPNGSKTVWTEVAFDGSEPRPPGEDDDVDTILAQWQDDPETPEQRYMVVLGDVPTDLLLDAKAHIDNLVREFSLAAAGAESGEAVPEHLAYLIETVVHGFADARAAIKRQAVAAAHRGEPRTRLTLHLPAGAADAGEAYLEALDEADGYARAARLLTLETPPDHRLFRHWYVESLVAQLRHQAAGEEPPPITSFEERLVSEVRRLSAAQRVNRRFESLQRVTAALARTSTPEDVAAVVVSEGVAALGASGGGLLMPATDGQHLAVPGVVGYGEELVGQFRSERLDAELPAATAVRTGESIWLESPQERDELFPLLRGFEAATVSMCAVPLILAGRTLGALRFSFDRQRLFDSDERAFVSALAALTAQTLHRAGIYEAERRAALELQRALLPEGLTQVPGWDLAAYYAPAGEQEAGGDFYDVIRVPGQRIAAIIGDVMGRGAEAAAAMAQIRSTIRAYALDDPDPASVFQKVDAYFEALELDQLVTVLYFLVDPADGSIQLANAGHLPPLLATGTDCRAVPTVVGLPFGAGGDHREATQVDLPAGAALIAITDGLVERRGEDIDQGVDALISELCGTDGWTAPAILDHVVATAAAERQHDDDVTVLVLRRL